MCFEDIFGLNIAWIQHRKGYSPERIWCAREVGAVFLVAIRSRAPQTEWHCKSGDVTINK